MNSTTTVDWEDPRWSDPHVHVSNTASWLEAERE